MIPPRLQWAQQIDVTDVCPRNCSNCTRLLGHVQQNFFMPLAQIADAIDALKDFPSKSPPDAHRRKKVVGIIGGEPLLHPDFVDICKLMREKLPAEQRGLWTGLTWQTTKYADIIRDVFAPPAYINPNDHTTPCFHFPVLVAIREVVSDEAQMWELIDACPLQREWSGTITPDGYFMCEVMAALHRLFGGPGGKPVAPGCWDGDVSEYADQIKAYCPRCGIAIPMPDSCRRKDSDNIDDISPGNLADLEARGTVTTARCALFDVAGFKLPACGCNPLKYLR